MKGRYKVWFFGGGETKDDRFNIFTGSYVSLMKEIMEDDFEIIKGIYFKSPLMNVIWALNHAQKPHGINRLTMKALNQIISDKSYSRSQLILTSSSSGSIVAAQTACLLAEAAVKNQDAVKPFHIALGSSMISRESELFKKLVYYQRQGKIDSIIYDEVQDPGDNTTGIGGTSRKDAYINALGVAFPLFSSRFKAPSFLNTHPVNGHIHRKRAGMVEKAVDYINAVLITHNLAGEHFCDKAEVVLNRISENRYRQG